MNNSYDAFLSQPVINGEKFESLTAITDAAREDYNIGAITVHGDYSDGQMSLNVIAESEMDEEEKKKMIQEFPSTLIMKLLEQKDSNNKPIFGSATYGGYKVEEAEAEEGEDPEKLKDKVTFDTTVKLNGRKSAYVPVEEATEPETQAAE